MFSLAFSPDGGRIVSSGGYGHGVHVKVWDAATGADIMTLRGHTQPVASVGYSPDGRRIISGSWDGTAILWDASTGAELMTLRHGDTIWTVVVSPDGKRLVTGGNNDMLKIWDAQTGAEVRSLRVRELGVISAAFSPDGRRIVSCGRTNPSVSVWDVETGAEVITLYPMGASTTSSIAASPDGQTLAVGHNEGITLLESAAPTAGYGRRQIAEAAQRLVQELYEKQGYYCEVLDRLRTDSAFKEPVRGMAMQIANSHQQEDIDKLSSEAREVVSDPDRGPETYRAALDKAERLNRLGNEEPNALTLLGAAQCRTGAYQDALVTLTRAEKMPAGSPGESSHAQVNLALQVVALHQLGRPVEEKVAVDRLRDRFGWNWPRQDEMTQGLLFEAQKLAAGSTDLSQIYGHMKAGRLDEAAQLVEKLRSQNDPNTAPGVKYAATWLGTGFYYRGQSLGQLSPQYAERIADYERATRVDPNHGLSLNALAWLLVTCPVRELCNGAKAVEAATRACETTGGRDHEYFNTLAATCSEIGDYVNASKWQKEAIRLLPDDKRLDLQSVYEQQLRVYELGKPYHEGSLWSFSQGELVAWWKLDQAEGDSVLDSSGNGHNAKLAGGASIVPDPERGNVLRLCEGAFVDCGSSPDYSITGALTLAAWVKIHKSDKPWQPIISKGVYHGWMLSRARNADCIEFTCNGLRDSGGARATAARTRSSAQTTADVNDNRWHQVVAVYDGANASLYIDGKLDNSVATWGSISTDREPIYIGDDPFRPGYSWNGFMDDVRIYSYALSPEEVKMLYEGQEPRREKHGE